LRDFEEKKRQILARVGILDVVSQHVAMKRRGQRWVGLCPFHAEKTPSFTVSPEHGTFKCFGCGKGGDVFSFVQLRENVPFPEAMRMLADQAGIVLDHGSGKDGGSGGPSRTDLAKINAWAAGHFRAQLLHESVGRSAREYVSRRNLSAATAERFGLGLAPDSPGSLSEAARRAGVDSPLLLAADLVRQSERGQYYDTFRNRLMFPIRDATGRVVGFGGRTLGDDPAKYINTRQTALFDKGRGLYGIDLARKSAVERGRAIIVEGYTDCLAAHQAGFTETVATLGTALTESQVELLRRYCEQIILLFDSDEAGDAAAERAIRTAVPRCVTVRLARIPEGKDPAEFLGHGSATEFSDLLNRSVEALEFKWHQTRRRFEGDASGTRRREAVLDFLRIVAEAVDAKAIDAIQRGLLVNQVAHLLRMDRIEVDRLLVHLSPRRGSGGAQAKGQAVGQLRRASRDAEQVAWTRVLEALLSEPGAGDSVDGLPDATRIADQRDRRIAMIVFELVPKPGGFCLADVLGRCGDAADAERVSELACRGAALRDHRATLRLALARTRRAGQESELEESKQRLLEAAGRGSSVLGGTDCREIVSDGVRQHTHFAPRRLIRLVEKTQATMTGATGQNHHMERP
jgi:DNA primase